MLSATGGMSYESNVFYKRLVALLSNKWKDLYAEIRTWMDKVQIFLLFVTLSNSVYQDHHVAITSEVPWLWFNRKPSFLFLFNFNCIVLFSVHVISVLLLFVIDIRSY